MSASQGSRLNRNSTERLNGSTAMASGAWPRHSMPSGRGPSSAWGRLKPVELDPLEAMGLPSKGETRLLDFKTQNQYYTEIVKRYLAFCSDAGGRDSLLAQFAALSVEPSATSGAAAAAATGSSSSSGGSSIYSLPQPTTATIAAATADSSTGGAKSKDLTVIMMALRKLREAIVASKRADDFAVQTYLFCIRLAVLVKQPESYHSAIQHLLRRINNRPQQQQQSQQQQEQLLSPTSPDSQHQHHGHNHSRHQQQQQKSRRLGRTSVVLSHAGHWRGSQDPITMRRELKRDNSTVVPPSGNKFFGHKARLMEFAEPSMRRHALLCLGRSYLSVDCSFLERCAGGRAWADLQKHDAVGWERDGQRVVIRRIKAK
ncbi:hypothetical protein MAPG_07858 [Magnaporthiopsis poae ATCC 64411]|uniref:CSN8/PSMD8/EIF3K domain-containing protein n=1 Tax=Magnaporthiopsis poae (strain ATCC 64411 / 73-15) TaxID=644358 RepID=A0A0C4E5T3_MAGP6|nr:hypothetical protein MAPG_07858 [Magnaporthiopsis poae ATCC 64411]